jgi:hypothetical protein
MSDQYAGGLKSPDSRDGGPVPTLCTQNPKIKYKKPRWGGGQMFTTLRSRGPAPLSRRDFFLLDRTFQRVGNEIHESFQHQRTLQAAFLFDRIGGPGGGQKSGDFRSGTGGQARKNRREIRENIFFQHRHRPSGKNRREIQGGGGRRWLGHR